MTTGRTLAIAAACLLAGCADFRTFCDEQLIASRNGYLARTAWKTRGASLCDDRKHYSDFRDGFYAGYLGVATGNGVAPLVPPSKYWAACYQDADGREMINDWFAGYNEGAFAASQDGIGELAEIPTWVGGACCDEHGRIDARPEAPGPRKPRRGDPPVRAHLPPPLPKIDQPKNSEGNAAQPGVETPAPSDSLDKVPLDPDAPRKDAPPADKSAPKKDDAKKVKTASRKTDKKADRVAAKSQPKPDSPRDADHWAKGEPTPVEPEMTPAKSPVETAEVRPWGPARASSTPTSPFAGKASARSQPLPVNPYARLNGAGPTYPVAPPVIEAPALKSSRVYTEADYRIDYGRGLKSAWNVDPATARAEPSPARIEPAAAKIEREAPRVEPAEGRIEREAPKAEQETSKPARTVGESEAYAPPPPKAFSGPRLMPPVETAVPLNRVRAEPTYIEQASHFEPAKPSSEAKPNQFAAPMEPTVRPAPKRPASADDDWTTQPVPKAVEDGWGTPHDLPAPGASK